MHSREDRFRFWESQKYFHEKSREKGRLYPNMVRRPWRLKVTLI